MSRQKLSALDRLAVAMARESRTWAICSELGFFDGAKGRDKAPMLELHKAAKKEVELASWLAAKAHPELALGVLLRGALEDPTDEPLDFDHSDVDRAIEAEFDGKAVSPGSESDSFWCYCSSEMEPMVQAFLRKRFPTLDFEASKPAEISIHGLGSWDDAELHCLLKGVERMAWLTEPEMEIARRAAKSKSDSRIKAARKAGAELVARVERILGRSVPPKSAV